MAAEIPTTSPEKKEVLDDNALKFTLNGIDADFLQDKDAQPYLLITDWLEMGEDSEKKLAYKKFANGDVQILLIQKFTDQNGNRTVPPKEALSQEQYEQLLQKSVQRVEKIRYEFHYFQNDTKFTMKYDEFVDSALCILEVDADSAELRESFDSSDFPYELTDVTGNIEYYGYRVSQHI